MFFHRGDVLGWHKQSNQRMRRSSSESMHIALQIKKMKKRPVDDFDKKKIYAIKKHYDQRSIVLMLAKLLRDHTETHPFFASATSGIKQAFFKSVESRSAFTHSLNSAWRHFFIGISCYAKVMYAKMSRKNHHMKRNLY